MKRPQPINRREILKLGKALSRPEAEVRGRGAPALVDQMVGRRAAMGGYFEVRLDGCPPHGAAVIEAAFERIAELEDRLTIHRDDSEIIRINRQAHESPMPVEPELFALLARADRIARETGGAFDVTAGALSIAWGFIRGPKRVPTSEELALARALSGYEHMVLDRDHSTVAFDRQGVVINLGAIGKGYAIDESVRILRESEQVRGALVHGGRSSAAALGSPLRSRGWEIALRNPWAPESPLGAVWLRDRALGTSGASFQHFEAEGRRFGHVIDPRTGEPPETGPESVTVLAPAAADADALSTAFYLLGPERTRDFLKNRPELAAIFAIDDPVRGRRVVAFGIGVGEFRDAPGLRWDLASIEERV